METGYRDMQGLLVSISHTTEQIYVLACPDGNLHFHWGSERNPTTHNQHIHLVSDRTDVLNWRVIRRLRSSLRCEKKNALVI